MYVCMYRCITSPVSKFYVGKGYLLTSSTSSDLRDLKPL